MFDNFLILILSSFIQGMSGPIFGLCPSSRDWLKESSGNPLTGRDWIKAPPVAPRRLDDTDDVMRQLAYKKIDAFSGIGHGFFFWNFRTDLYEPQWSYVEALDRGWIPSGNLMDAKIQNACLREDSGDFKCVLKKGQIDKAVRDAVGYVLGVQNLTQTPEAKAVLNRTGSDLDAAAGPILSDFFDKNRHMGATCDFGGVAMLIESNLTLSDDDTVYYGDDEYFFIHEGPNWWVLGLAAFGIAIAAGVGGFILAMRYNANFNTAIRNTALFRPLTGSKNKLIRSSLALPQMQYDEIEELIKKEDDF